MRVLKKGFSTAEMLVTIMLFSFGILPLIVLFQNSHKQTAQAKNLMIAQSIGRSIISEYRSLGFRVLDDKLGDSSEVTFNYKFEEDNERKVVPEDDSSIEYPEYYKRFKYTITLSRALDNRDTNNKIRVELDVEWLEPDMRKPRDGTNFKLGFGTVVVKYDT